MRVQHNIPAMSSYRNYANNNKGINKNLEKLSSGYKINRAGDDAAGLAISEKMRAQITGLEGAQKNAKDGISLVQTAEGALTEVHSMLKRMVSLAEQSANGTYDSSLDRNQLQKEVEQLRTEIDRIADSSNFNGIQLLNGTQVQRDANVGENALDLAGAVKTLGKWKAGTDNAVKTTAAQAAVSEALSGVQLKLELTANGTDKANEIAKYKVTLSKGTDSVSGTNDNVDLSISDSHFLRFSGSDGKLTVFGKNADGTIDTNTSFGTFGNNAAFITFVEAGKTTEGYAKSDATALKDITIEVNLFGQNDGLQLQIGDTSDSYNQMQVDIGSIKSYKLGLDGCDGQSNSIATIDISTQAGATSAMDVIKAAINNVSDVRGTLGATQNRLEHTINNLSVMQENIQDAEGTIRDTDVADEMMAYTKNSILVQSAQAMLAQANQLPQGVLQLLQ